MNIEEQLTKLKEERDQLKSDLSSKSIRLKVVEKTIKETEKLINKVKERLNANP